VGALLIESGGAVSGVVSERDVARALADDADPDEVWAADVSRRPLVRVGSGESVDDVGRRMLDEGVRHAVVMDADTVVGVVSMRDVLAALVRRARGRPSSG
jgi:CBS domain-containing protein